MEIMSTLINIDTTHPPGKTYREYVTAISPYFEELGYKLEEVIIPEERYKKITPHLKGPRINLVGTKNYKQDKNISFYGHMDVVPATHEGQQKWRFPPFKATMIKSGKIYGRGTADMKGAMVGLILALQIIDKLNLIPKFNIRVLNCTDEEGGPYPGVAYLAEKGYVKGTIFCMEGANNPTIMVGSYGSMNVIVETFGRSCHSAVNFMGVNALEQTIPILTELMKLKEKVEKRESDNIPGLPRPGSNRKWNFSPMFNLNIMNVGTKANIVPDHCTLLINRRIIPEEKYEDVKKEIEEAIERGKAKSKLLNVKTTFNMGYPPMNVDINSLSILRLKKVIASVKNIPEEKITHLGMPGSTDIGLVNKILNTQDIIVYGVGYGGSNGHGVNENIRLKDLKTFIKEIIVFLCLDM
jgi:succinyl-diaminopimelate desuccinylase